VRVRAGAAGALNVSRRAFLARGAAAAAGAALPLPALAQAPVAPRHLLFEYYPWYRTSPWVHWDQYDRVPPHDIASTCVPRLGAYDSLDPRVLEQHASWIAQSGATGIDLSWWGPGSLEDQAVPAVMDVMRAHGLKVAFHLEPYDDDRGRRYAEDVLYLVREYGDRRGWDAMLLLRTASGRLGPVFKSFRTILPRSFVDCRGVERLIRDFTPDGEWRRQTDEVRDSLRRDFDHVLLYADSTEFARTPASGFDGISVYDPFVVPDDYVRLGTEASRAGLLATFSVNPGYDAIEPRRIEPESCYEPADFAPETPRGPEFKTPAGREAAALLSASRIEASYRAAAKVARDPASENARRGVDLLYVTSFNEWHEGTAFEPMKDAADLLPAERVHGYHNPENGLYRLETLRHLQA
jgi:hypothetical protein